MTKFPRNAEDPEDNALRKIEAAQKVIARLQSRVQATVLMLVISVSGCLVLGALAWKLYDRGNNWKEKASDLRAHLFYREQLGVAAADPLVRFNHLLKTNQVPDALKRVRNAVVSFGNSEKAIDLEQLIKELEEPCLKFNRSCLIRSTDSAPAKQ